MGSFVSGGASDDLQTEVAIRINPEGEFGYTDSRSVTGEERQNYECCLIIFMTPVQMAGEPETVAVGVLRDQG